MGREGRDCHEPGMTAPWPARRIFRPTHKNAAGTSCLRYFRTRVDHLRGKTRLKTRKVRMDHSYSVAAEHLGARKGTLLSQWRELLRPGSQLPRPRLTLTDEEWEDHPPPQL